MSKNFNKHNQDIVDIIASVRRVTKVVKGGSRFSFSILVVVGDKKGKVGFASAKDRELNDAKNKAIKLARKNMFHVPLRSGKTLHHDILTRYCSASVLLRSAKLGTGIIAGGAMRHIFECLGIQDIVAKSLRSSDPYNMITATMLGLKSISTPRAIAERRGIRFGVLLSRRENI
ncbi:30S ribosomal subunit protein S5 [Candidatus Xenohaliotis californiensis]|uniref:Small ribosomal subunit protein uS5 n=1 Tax=Candidatus Xenohaliotis californiensis TaxID=84677 RepID=A0ABM9N8K8_9RICK|nr:30S ribosomal subunit protein S5 [Candidatus Xenohaliotis californiensis]